MSVVLFCLYADLDEEVYMSGMDIQEGYCLKQEKNLY